jgi:rare lipoprotein A
LNFWQGLRGGLAVFGKLAFASTAIILAACAPLAPEQRSVSTPAEPQVQPQGNSRYQQAQDGAPLRELDTDTIVDAVPRYEPLKVAGNISPYIVRGQEYRLVENHRKYKARGTASWYGTKFDGHATSNGETYSLYDMTAAHKTLPIPCYVKVTNLRNGRTAIVRVNDRGPFHSERIIDLSYAAAVKLGFSDQGTASVEIEVIDTDNSAMAKSETARYYLQVGAFKELDSANKLQKSLSSGLGYPVMVAITGQSTLHRVRVGPFVDFSSAQAAKKILKQRWSGEPQLVVESDEF